MGKRITEEKIIEINEVYLECKVKSKTAEIVGVSPSTVSKYLIPNYISQKKEEKVEFTKEITGAQDFIDRIIGTVDCSPVKALCEICKLTQEEWDEMKEIQKGIMI
jgi:predicted transcriptional regulator